MRTSYTAIQEAARRLLEANQTDITQQVRLAPLARQLAEAEQCSYDQARRAIARAVRRARGAQVPTWGGEREGAGIPTTALLRAGAEALVTMNGATLGSGTIAVTRDGSIRIAIIELARGGELRIAVEKDQERQ